MVSSPSNQPRSLRTYICHYIQGDACTSEVNRTERSHLDLLFGQRQPINAGHHLCLAEEIVQQACVLFLGRRRRLGIRFLLLPFFGGSRRGRGARRLGGLFARARAPASPSGGWRVALTDLRGKGSARFDAACVLKGCQTKFNWCAW